MLAPLPEKTEMLILNKTIHDRYAKYGTNKSCGQPNLSCGGALNFAEVQPNEVLVDLGSGRGRDVMQAAKIAKYAYGIDFTPEMTSAGTAKCADENIHNVSFRLGSIDDIPLSDNFIDVAISNCAINHAPDKRKVFSEIFRILKPGGRFIVSDIISESEIPKEIANDHAAVAGCYGGAIVKEEYINAIIESGFPEVEILEESKPYDKNGVMIRSITIRSYKKR